MIQPQTLLKPDAPGISHHHIQTLPPTQSHDMLHIQPRPVQIRGKRSPERMRITRQPGLLLQPIEHDLDASAPYPTVSEEPDEICRTLEAIVYYNPELTWEGQPGASRVLLLTWTSWDGYNDKAGVDYQSHEPYTEAYAYFAEV